MIEETEKSRQDRAKFERIKKVEIPPLITQISLDHQKSDMPDLRSPDEKLGKWYDDPLDVKKMARISKNEISKG